VVFNTYAKMADSQPVKRKVITQKVVFNSIEFEIEFHKENTSLGLKKTSVAKLLLICRMPPICK